MNQVYIDPTFLSGNVIMCYIFWDYKTRMKLKVTFLDRKNIYLDRLSIINFIQELIRRNGINVVMTKQEFINMHFREFPKLKIEIVKIDF